MNTTQLKSIMYSDECLRQIEHGVFPIDCIPIITRLPLAYIINASKHNEPGSHWVAMYVDKNFKCEFFDSYGRHPNTMPILYEYMNRNFGEITYNNKRIQAYLTSTCGQFCLYFLLWRVRGVSMRDIIQSMHYDYGDEFVTGFINGLFQVNTLVIDENFIVNQICDKHNVDVEF